MPALPFVAVMIRVLTQTGFESGRMSKNATMTFAGKHEIKINFH